MSGTLNFNQLPKTNQPANNIEPGRHTLVIIKGVKEISKEGKEMLVLTNVVEGTSKPEIVDRYPLFNKDKTLANYGPYKLNCLMEVTNVKPESDFTIEGVGAMLTNKRYSAVLLSEEYQGKNYLKVGFPEDFENVGQEVATPEPQTPTPSVSPEVKGALDEDQDI